MTSNRTQMIELIEQDKIAEHHLNQALQLSGVTPNTQRWFQFVNQLLAWFGGLALMFSVLFFIAYNWHEMGRFAKFMLVEVLIVLSVIGYYFLDKKARKTQQTEGSALSEPSKAPFSIVSQFKVSDTVAKIPLLMASIFFGVLLALFGQTYQTGADPWQLFFNWALLIIPWVIIGRLSALWMVWIGLLNLAVLLYFLEFGGVGLFGHQDLNALWSVFSINAIALLCWELMSRRYTWLTVRWAPRVLASVSGYSITWLTLLVIVDANYIGVSRYDLSGENLVPVIVWLIWVGLMYIAYRRFRQDLFMLAGTLLSANIIIISFLTTHLLNDIHELGFLLMSFTTIGMAAGSAMWLRNINKEWQS
ncbi:DUF2157 domain-containing protein [Shewanella japonica]|uniref:DUF2157 domain-containing protein n=1 Tax=Shewanella japonica TaxID=93973 RepID=UPI0013C443E6|nr:DUF2157 domain-containing protein [Shewanella japonica]